jgi:hypothetical protein
MESQRVNAWVMARSFRFPVHYQNGVTKMLQKQNLSPIWLNSTHAASQKRTGILRKINMSAFAAL